MPDIQIPLHTVRIGRLVLPLTLSFHTDSYSRPNQLAGSIGKGWSLSTELQITRQINGLDDLDENSLAPGYCYNDVPADYHESDPVQRSELNARDLYFGKRDEEPDRFYYRLLGKSGAFYFQHRTDGSVKVAPIPYNGVKIKYGDKRFTIWDTDGTKYVFSATATDTERPIPERRSSVSPSHGNASEYTVRKDSWRPASHTPRPDPARLPATATGSRFMTTRKAQ